MDERDDIEIDEMDTTMASEPLVVESIETEKTPEEPTGDAAVGAAITQASKAGMRAATDASKSLASGFSAMRDVRRAKKQRADAQIDLREIKRGLELDRNELAHREDVERNFDEIVTTQSTEIAHAQAEEAKLTEEIGERKNEAHRLRGELRSMKERHEQKLRPYRNLMESSRGRSDDAAKALANARRAVRSAESAVNGATKRRQQRIDAANRAVDNAQERLSNVQNELSALQTDPDASPAALAKMQSELSSEQAHLQSAREDVVQTTRESQESVDQAQQNLWALQRELTTAEKAAAEAKEQATTHKNEYDGRYRDAQAKEKAKEDAIKSCETKIHDLEKSLKAAEAREAEAQKILDEANEIHDHPETTEGLRQRIADEEDDLATAEADLEELTETERELRRSTRGVRTALIVACAVLVVLIVFLIWFFGFRQ